jgi:hypothetical protein
MSVPAAGYTAQRQSPSGLTVVRLLVSLVGACQVHAPSADGTRTPTVAQSALDVHYLQRSMAYELPLPLATWLGTHNSSNVNNRTSVFFEDPHNQMYNIDAQLRYLGVRYLEIDVHYTPELRSCETPCSETPASWRSQELDDKRGY